MTCNYCFLLWQGGRSHLKSESNASPDVSKKPAALLFKKINFVGYVFNATAPLRIFIQQVLQNFNRIFLPQNNKNTNRNWILTLTGKDCSSKSDAAAFNSPLTLIDNIVWLVINDNQIQKCAFQNIMAISATITTS